MAGADQLWLHEQHKDMPAQELMAVGAVERLRPILLTTISTVAGLMPLAYSLGGIDPYMSPMALAWGLLFATVLTLFLAPCLYVIGDDIMRVINRCRRPQTSPQQ